MTPRRSGLIIRKVRDISVGAALTLLTGFAMESCSCSNEEKYETVQEVVYTKGVRTNIKETSPGIFKIIDEQSVDSNASTAVVTYADGRVEQLTPAAAKALIDNKIKTDKTMVGVDNSLANALLFGGMGFLLANQADGAYLNNYRKDFYESDKVTKNGKDSTKTRTHRSHSGIGFLPIFFASRMAYNSSSAATQSVGGSRTTRSVTRPVGGRSGFFGGSRSRSSGG